MGERVERKAHGERESGAEVGAVGSPPGEGVLPEQAVSIEQLHRGAQPRAAARHADAEDPRRGRVDRVAAEAGGDGGAEFLRGGAALGAGAEDEVEARARRGLSPRGAGGDEAVEPGEEREESPSSRHRRRV